LADIAKVFLENADNKIKILKEREKMTTKTIASKIITDLENILKQTEDEFESVKKFYPGVMIHLAQTRVNKFLEKNGLNSLFIIVDCDKS